MLVSVPLSTSTVCTHALNLQAAFSVNVVTSVHVVLKKRQKKDKEVKAVHFLSNYLTS